MNNMEQFLYQVAKPARYTGGEWNSITKDWDKTNLKIALSYPDLYDIGMSNMAIPILYEIFNRQEDVLAERVYAPWGDMAAILQSHGIPLFSLETKHPLREFDVIGFSLGYELTYTNVLNMLHLAGISLKADERDSSFPLVMAGGTCALNPEPMADFIDFFVMGDGEEVVLEITDALRQWKPNGKRGSRQELLRRVAAIEGVYVPSFYKVAYQPDGRIENVTPTVKEVKPVIQQRLVATLPPTPTRPVVPYIETTHDRGAIEIQRGCSNGCRFCQAGVVYRPVRTRTPEEIVQAAGDIIENCGYDEISLVSLSTGNYPEIFELVTKLLQRYQQQNIGLSLPSLHIDAAAVRLMDLLPSRRKTGLTFAPEAGSARLQQVINKRTSDERLMHMANAAFSRGWTGLKLYFMIGLPTETTEDVLAIIDLVDRVQQLGSKNKMRKPQIRLTLSTFIPKPHTPFQWVAQDKEDVLNAKHEILREGLRRKGIRLSWSDPKASLLEAVLSRGDRRVGKAIYRAWELGSTYDAWSECFKWDNWLQAFNDTGIDPAFYAQRERPLDETLPWSHIATCTSTEFLQREYRRAISALETVSCSGQACLACGVQNFYAPCQQKLTDLKKSG